MFTFIVLLLKIIVNNRTVMKDLRVEEPQNFSKLSFEKIVQVTIKIIAIFKEFLNQVIHILSSWYRARIRGEVPLSLMFSLFS